MKILASLLVVGVIARAHHSTAPFDMTKETTVHGVVIDFVWSNPHSYIHLQSDAHKWTLEAEALNVLRRNGWTKNSVKPGDEISCTGARAKDVDVYAMKCFTVVFPDGRKLIATPVGGAPQK